MASDLVAGRGRRGLAGGPPDLQPLTAQVRGHVADAVAARDECPPRALLDHEHVAGRDIVHLVSSPLERAQETMEPIATVFGLTPDIDERVIEAAERVGADGAVIVPLGQPPPRKFARSSAAPAKLGRRCTLRSISRSSPGDVRAAT